MIQKLLKHKKKIVIVIIFISLLFGLFSNLGGVEYAFASDTVVGDAINLASKALLSPFVGALKIILDVLVWLIGQVSTLVIALLFVVAEYNHFINETIVIRGWVVIRDICNMFFVLLLLIIAFATILRIPNYEVKKTLPRLLIMAVLINFSKTICGLIIDFGQVFMLTFIAPFGNNTNFSLGHAGLVQAFHLDQMFSVASYASGIWDYATNSDVTVVSTVATMLFGFVLVVIATIVIATFALMLLYRIIVLWILIILSPLAYIAAAFPNFNKYSSQWWNEFIKNVIVGPVMAFFLWLALSISTANDGNISSNINNLDGAVTSAGQSGQTFSATLSPLGDVNILLSYLMTAAFLIGGMMAAQQVGGAAGGIASKGMGMIQAGKGLAWKGVKGGTDWLNRKQARTTGVDLNPFRQAERLKGALTRNKDRDLKAIKMKSSDNLEKGGMRGLVTGFTSEGWADQYAQGFLGMKGLKKAVVGSAKGVYYSKNKGLLSTGKAILGMGKGSEPYTEKLVEDLEITNLKNKGAIATAKDYKEERDKLEAEEKNAKFDKNSEAEQKAQAKIKVLDEGWRYNLENPSNSGDKAKVERYEKIQESKDKRMKIAYDSGDTVLYDKVAEEKKDITSKINKITKPKDDFITTTRKESEKQGDKIGIYNVKDLEGQSQTRAAIAEQGRNITSENEDELVADFRGAVAENNMPLAAAIAKQIVKIGGGNALLGNFGYSVRGGMTREESDKLKSEGRTKEIEEKRGVNDFMRDIFGDKLKMSESAMLALQSDLGELGKNINHDYLAGTVSANSKGKLYQVGEDDQAANIDNETSKGDAETFTRRANRLKYGSEDKKTGKFKWSQSGLMLVAQNAGSIMKEIGGARFNRSAAKKFAEDDASKTLLDYLKKLDREGVEITDKEGKTVTPNEYVKKIVEYGKSGSQENLETMKKAAKDFA